MISNLDRKSTNRSENPTSSNDARRTAARVAVGETQDSDRRIALRSVPMVVTKQSTESLVATDRSVSVDIAPVRFDQLIAETLVTTLRMIMIDERLYGSAQRRFDPVLSEDHRGE